MIEGKTFTPTTPWQKDMVRRFSDIMLCKTFTGWTPQIIADLPSDFYNDTILVLQKESAKAKRDADKK